MQTSASAVANYLLDLDKDNGRFKQLGLMRRIYIIHGFSLALLNKSALDKRFDRVEAWRFGTVIPSIHHEFKHFGGNSIDPKFRSKSINLDTLEPERAILKDMDIKKICKLVLDIYDTNSDNKMGSLTHDKGTPWWISYKLGENKVIEDVLIKAYYDELVERLLIKCRFRNIT